MLRADRRCCGLGIKLPLQERSPYSRQSALIGHQRTVLRLLRGYLSPSDFLSSAWPRSFTRSRACKAGFKGGVSTSYAQSCLASDVITCASALNDRVAEIILEYPLFAPSTSDKIVVKYDDLARLEENQFLNGASSASAVWRCQRESRAVGSIATQPRAGCASSVGG